MPYGSTDGEGWNDVFHPDDQERAWTRWRHSLETGEPYEIEYRLRHRDGAYRWTLGRAMPIRDAEGRIERWFGTCTDIDDLKRAEAEARKLAAIVEASKDFIGLYTLGGAVTHLNEAALALVGLPDLAAARRHRMEDFFSPESRRVLAETVLPAVQQKGYWRASSPSGISARARRSRSCTTSSRCATRPAPRSATPPSPGTCARPSAPRRPATC